jgi:hypothetical protein
VTEEEKAELEKAKGEAAEARKEIEKLRARVPPEKKPELDALEARLAKAEEALKDSKGKKDAAEIRGASEESIHAVLEVSRELLAHVKKEKAEKRAPVRWSPW